MKWFLLTVAALLLVGCESDSVGPRSVPCDDFLMQFSSAPGDTVQAAGGLRYIDVRPGSGEIAVSGRAVEVNYSGYLLDGTRFDTSCPTSRTVLQIALGASQVIAGFEIGITGMREGGVRRIIVPPELGYGNQPQGPIPANSTLIFDVQLVSVSGS